MEISIGRTYRSSITLGKIRAAEVTGRPVKERRRTLPCGRLFHDGHNRREGEGTFAGTGGRIAFMNGILIVDKPVGITSQIVIGRMRTVTGVRKIGHAGTLDPLASGVLPVMIGNATKACEYLMDHDKVYVASVKLGITTDTEDITGEVLTRHRGALPSFEAFAQAAQSFVGEIQQVPPMYSALKKDGMKLVDLARMGVTVEREARTVTVHSIQAYEENGEFFLKVHCSRGTYIRTLCADIGRMLGCGACMASLRRCRVGQFDEIESLPLDVLIMDPPRSGSDEGFLRSVLTCKRKTIVYVSCNPETLARDARFLVKDQVYRAVKAVPVDMFPHTEHCECVMLFQRREG